MAVGLKKCAVYSQVDLNIWMHVHMYVCMYVCVYVCSYIHPLNAKTYITLSYRH